MTYRLSTALVAAAVLLTGCAGQSYRVPVEDRNGQPPVSESARPAPGVVVRPVAPVPIQGSTLPSRPARPSTAPAPYNPQPDYTPTPDYAPDRRQPAARSSRNPAVVALLSNASRQTRAGSLGSAQASLERAQRIAPRDPEVYYQLADLQRRKGDYRQAEQMALRGLEVAMGQPRMQRSLWGLISQVRKASGDARGARQALDKARQY